MSDHLEPIIGAAITGLLPRLVTVFLLSLRTAAVFAIAPWPGNVVPMQIRMMLSMLIAIVVCIALPDSEIVRVEGRSLFLASLGELLYGGALALALWVATSALTICGQLGGLQMGFGMAASIDPTTQSHMNTLAQIALLIWIPIALDLGMHHQLIRTLAHSSIIQTVAAGAPIADRLFGIAQASLVGGSEMFSLALMGAGPVYALTMIAQAGLGAISRALPNAMIIGEALGAAAILGLVALTVSISSWISITESSLSPILAAFGR